MAEHKRLQPSLRDVIGSHIVPDEPYMPTEAEFIDTYAENVRVFHPERPEDEEEARDEARRFLAQVRAEARREGAAAALREAADDMGRAGLVSEWHEDWIRDRASRLEGDSNA